MKKTIFILVFALMAFTSSAQSYNTSKDWAKIELIQKSKKTIGDNISSDVQGSLYYSDKYASGKLFFKGNELERDMLYRYEAYSDIIEVKLKNGEEDYLAQSPKLEVLIGNNLYNYIQFYDEAENEMTFGYMIVLEQNEKYNLYDRKIKKLRPGKKAQTSMSADLEAKLLDNETIYFRLAGDKHAKSFPENKSALYKMFPSQKSELKKFLKNEKIDLENPQDIARVIEFCL
jgi:hypothetical protein